MRNKARLLVVSALLVAGVGWLFVGRTEPAAALSGTLPDGSIGPSYIYGEVAKRGNGYQLDAPRFSATVSFNKPRGNTITVVNGNYGCSIDNQYIKTNFIVASTNTARRSAGGYLYHTTGSAQQYAQSMNCSGGENIVINVPTLTLSGVPGYEGKYVATVSAAISSSNTSGGINAFKIQASSGGVVGLSSGFRNTTNGSDSGAFALQDRRGPSTGDVTSTFTLEFAPPCDLPTRGLAVPLQWFDADAGARNQPQNISFRVREYDRITGAETNSNVASASGSALGGNGDFRQITGVTFRPDRKYVWTWSNVNRRNGIQIYLPFDGLNTGIGCTPPDVCSNITGNQASIPAGYTRSGTTCTFPPPVCTGYSITAFAGNSFKARANYRNRSSATLEVTSVVYSGSGVPGVKTVSRANIAGGRSMNYQTAGITINTPAKTYAVTWRLSYNTLYGQQSVACRSSITINGQIFTCGARRNETSVAAGSNFTTYVNFKNNNPLTVRASSIRYSIARVPSDSINTSGNGRPSSVSVGGGGDGKSTSGTMRIPSVGKYTITWTINSPYGKRTCTGTITVTFTPPTCTANTFSISVGQTARPNFSLVNNSGVAVAITRADYRIDGPRSASFRGDLPSGSRRPNLPRSATRSYPPANGRYNPGNVTGLGPFGVAGKYSVRWTVGWSAAGTSGTINEASCRNLNGSTVALEPYVRFYGNDVVTCDQPGSSDYNGDIRTHGAFDGPSNNLANWRGSASELAFFAAGQVERFAAGALKDRRPGPITALSFANVGPGLGGGFMGGCNVRSSPSPAGSSGGDLSQLSTLNGSYQRSEDTTIARSGSTNIANKNIVIHVDGDVTIGSNITYNTGNWTLDTIPSVKVFATGNIYIRPGVTQLDGEYSAGGEILTCTNRSSLPTDATLADSCQSSLVVNGSLSARRIHFLRIKGTVLRGTEFEQHVSPGIAESIRFSPDAYLLRNGGGLQPNPGGAPPYDSIIARPPTF